jgi:hypothetical protein
MLHVHIFPTDREIKFQAEINVTVAATVFMFQGHSKTAQRCDTNSGTQASENSSELVA